MRAEALMLLLLAAPVAAAQAPEADPAAAAATDLGTLFHSPDERARLDKLRRGELPEPPAAKRGPPAVTGFVQRSDGRNTVWIDGRPVPVTSPKAAPLFDPRVVRDMPSAKAEPEPEAPKADPEGAKPRAEAPKGEKRDTTATPQVEGKAEVKR